MNRPGLAWVGTKCGTYDNGEIEGGYEVGDQEPCVMCDQPGCQAVLVNSDKIEGDLGSHVHDPDAVIDWAKKNLAHVGPSRRAFEGRVVKTTVGKLKQVIKEALHQHMEEVSWEDVKRWCPEAYEAAYSENFQGYGYQAFLFEPLEGDDDDTIDVDGERWVLHVEGDEDGEAYEWDPNSNEWENLAYHG